MPNRCQDETIGEKCKRQTATSLKTNAVLKTQKKTTENI